LFSPGENQIVKVEVDWTAALDRRAGPPRWTTESQSKLQSFALDHQPPPLASCGKSAASSQLATWRL
jgi:hypothetical protein